MFEIQKIEELKQEIDKSNSLKEYISKEIEDLQERVRNIETDNKQNFIEYKIKKQELEQKLQKLKTEMLNEEVLNQQERDKYSQIENDIKNKISFVSLQNSNLSGPSSLYDDINKSNTNTDSQLHDEILGFYRKSINNKIQNRKTKNFRSIDNYEKNKDTEQSEDEGIRELIKNNQKIKKTLNTSIDQQQQRRSNNISIKKENEINENINNPKENRDISFIEKNKKEKQQMSNSENLNWIIDEQKSGMIDEIALKKQIFNLLKKMGDD